MRSFALHLMRHGEPVLPGRMLGRTDCAATPAGIAACVTQAGRLTESGQEVAHRLSSDLRRARECVEALGGGEIDPRWRELDFGGWDGQFARELDQDALARFWNDPDAFPPPSGETWSALVARVGEALAAIPTEPTLVVTHGGPIRAALHLLCGFDREQVWVFDLPYAAVVSLRVWEGSPRRAQVTGLVPCVA
ncbi:alpha-ribazole phosphatase [Sphingomonas palmae]|uniref:Alpha-ribazole phosphatase n=1 Tax=Sphingomonas palmae TaxID=1855283 RepID=A0A1H7GNJ3_9SPHN|nr:histidine phosphatase family protein [Sphingomonas palmae]SEK39723.1 alpha-ribazole phosphatase [Sphingomonas palmae]